MKLTNEECVEIARRKEAGASVRSLAADYHVGQFTINHALRCAELVTYPVLDGALERAKILKKMSNDFCGGCGQPGLCQLTEQSDSKYPPFMWLCGVCIETEVWR